MAAQAANDDEMITGINVTPLVDITLVLLVILIVLILIGRFVLGRFLANLTQTLLQQLFSSRLQQTPPQHVPAVQTFPQFLSHLQQQVQSGNAASTTASGAHVSVT